MKTFTYFTVADKDHAKMASTMVASARAVGVKEDFHVWTDLPEIPGAIAHPCGSFDKTLYMFKFHFLKNEVSKLNYDYFVFLDADTYFVSHPGNLADLMGSNKIFVQMENIVDPKLSKRQDWWSCPVAEYGPFLESQGAKRKVYYNTNAGFWIVAKEAINEFYEKTTKFFEASHKKGYKGFTEEPALAFVGHIMQDPEKRTLDDTSWLWCSDWTGQWKDRLPEYKYWQFEDYMSGEKKMVKPKIVHCMRSKEALIKEYDKSKNIKAYEGGFWIGHQLLGDVIGFVAAAHLLYVKTSVRQKVWFQESRKDILDYFNGVDWVPRESIPNAIDCGGDPTLEEWPSMNGVKRFYKWMDPSMTNPMSFDVHFNCDRKPEKLIGLITHANTQGDIPNSVVDNMVAQAREKYPEHTIVAIGNKDNSYVPQGVEDMRQDKGDIKWIVEMVRKLDLLITPQSGPCFIAAGFKIPMWVYRSKEAYWDYVLNYDEYKVEKWFERVQIAKGDAYSHFDNLYRNGWWDGMGSGPGSNPELNKEYLYMLHKIIDYTPGINTVIDIGCGDFQLMKELKHSKKYIGVDTSQYIIDENRKKYPRVQFECANIVTDELPSGELAIVRM